MNKKLTKDDVCIFSKRIENILGICSWILRIIEEVVQGLSGEIDETKKNIEKIRFKVEKI